MMTLNIIGLAVIVFVIFALALAIFAWPVAKLWYYLDEVQDETTQADSLRTDALSDRGE